MTPVPPIEKEDEQFRGKQVDATLIRATVVDAHYCACNSSLYLGRLRPIIIVKVERAANPSPESCHC